MSRRVGDRDRARPRYRPPPRRRAARSARPGRRACRRPRPCRFPPRATPRPRSRRRAPDSPRSASSIVAAQPGEQRRAVDPFDRGRGGGQVVGEARGQRVVFQHADALSADRPSPAARRSASPGFGVLTISLTGSVVLIHSDTRFDSAVANTGAPVLLHQQQRVRPVGREAGEPGHRARPHVVGVDARTRRCRPSPSRRAAAPAAPRAPRPAAPRHSIPSVRGAWLCPQAATLNSSRGVPVSTSQPSLVTATPSPSTM